MWSDATPIWKISETKETLWWRFPESARVAQGRGYLATSHFEHVHVQVLVPQFCVRSSFRSCFRSCSPRSVCVCLPWTTSAFCMSGWNGASSWTMGSCWFIETTTPMPRSRHSNGEQRWTTVNNGEDVSSENTRCGTLEHFETSSWKERFLSGLPPVIAGVAYQAMYQLKDATCFYEDRNSASLPKWMEGVVATVRCTRKEATRSTGSTWSAESTHQQILGRFTVSQGFDADFQLKPIVRCRSTLFFGIHFWLLLAHFGPKLVPSHSVIMQLKMNCFQTLPPWLNPCASKAYAQMYRFMTDMWVPKRHVSIQEHAHTHTDGA